MFNNNNNSQIKEKKKKSKNLINKNNKYNFHYKKKIQFWKGKQDKLKNNKY